MTALLVIGLILGVLVILTLVSAVTDTTINVAGKAIGRALQKPRPQGFVAIELSSSHVLRDLVRHGKLDPATGCLTTSDSTAVHLQAGWLRDVRGLECRWEPSSSETRGSLMDEVLQAILTIDRRARIVEV